MVSKKYFLGVASDVSCSDFLDRDVVDIESNISGDVGRGECDHHAGLEDTIPHLALLQYLQFCRRPGVAEQGLLVWSRRKPQTGSFKTHCLPSSQRPIPCNRASYLLIQSCCLRSIQKLGQMQLHSQFPHSFKNKLVHKT